MSCPLKILTIFLTLLAWFAPVVAGEIDELSLDDLINTRISTASRFSQPIAESPSSVTVIRGDEIRSHGWRSLVEALVSVPGFEVSNATDYSYLGVRGFSQPGDYNSRILLLIDGIPANDGVYDQALLGAEFPLDMDMIERLEIVPGSALYGGNAYLAVVNVFTRQSDSIGRSITLGAGSDGLVRGQASAGGKNEAGRNWLISASSEGSTGADRYFPQWQGVGGSDGWARGLNGERLRRLFMRVGGDDWSLHLLHGRRQKDAAGGMFATDFDVATPNIDATTQIGLRFQRTLKAGWALDSHAYVGAYSWQGRYRTGGTWESDQSRSGWLGASAHLTGKPVENQMWVLGIGIRDDFKRDQENVGGVIKSTRRTLSLFAQDEIRLNDILTLNFGGRYDRDTLGIGEFSPRGALLIKLSHSAVLKLMTSNAFRPPNAYESLYSYPGSQLAGGTLRPERIANTEIALEQVIGMRGRWTASVHRNRFKDLLGLTADFTTGLLQVQNVGDARTEGLELGAHYRFDGGLDVRGSLAWQRGQAVSGAVLPNSPAQLAKLLAIVPLGIHELGWETYYTGPRNNVFGDRVGGQAVSHASLSGRFSRDLRWQLRIGNLFDRRLATVVGGEYSLGAAGSIPTIEGDGRRLQIHLMSSF